jgi:hypothetical protein
MKNIYNLKLHETLSISGFEITRVPGGWIYIKRYRINIPDIMTFIPFNNEFQEEKLSNRPIGYNPEDNVSMGNI